MPKRCAQPDVSGRRRVASRLLSLAFAVMLIGCGGSRPATVERSNPNTPANVTVAQRVKAGEVLREAGQLDAALAEFNRALEINPDYIDAYLGIGGVERDQRQYEEARETYRRALRIDGFSFDARYYLGLMQQVLGETGQAILEYQRALDINPDDPDAHRDLATAYLQVGNPQQAVVHAERSVDLDATSQANWANLAAIYSILGRYEEALNAYRYATELGEIDEPVLLGLGDTHLKLDNVQRAVNTLQSLVLQWPSATGYERLGYALFRSRRFDDAEASYRRALSMNPDEVGALNGLGATLITEYVQSGQRDRRQMLEALDLWRQSLRARPNQDNVVNLLARYDVPD